MAINAAIGVPARQRCPDCGVLLRPRIGKKDRRSGLYLMRWEHQKPCTAQKAPAESPRTAESGTDQLDGARWRRRIEGAL